MSKGFKLYSWFQRNCSFCLKKLAYVSSKIIAAGDFLKNDKINPAIVIPPIYGQVGCF